MTYKDERIKPCPFCEGRAKISAKNNRFGGWNGKGECRREYLIKVICNKCKARGAPISTGWVKTLFRRRDTFFASQEDKEAFAIAEEKAIEAWNKRGNSDEQ